MNNNVGFVLCLFIGLLIGFGLGDSINEMSLNKEINEYKQEVSVLQEKNNALIQFQADANQVNYSEGYWVGAVEGYSAGLQDLYDYYICYFESETEAEEELCANELYEKQEYYFG